jgi:hypothetical protein
VLTRFFVEIASTMSFLVVSDRFKNMWMICVIFVVFLHLSVGLLNCVTETQQQQGNIIHTTTTLSQARWRLAATSSGELVFFGGGYNSTTWQPSDRVDIYNVTSGSWTTSTLSIPRGELAATSSQNLVFFGGGCCYTDRVDIYNTLNGSWSTATLSQSRCCLAATSVGNLVLFGGGDSSTNGASNVVDVFDVTNNTWTTATLSQARGFLAATSVDNRYALFGGGFNGSSISLSNVVDIFDSLSGNWSVMSSPLSEARAGLSATSLNDLVVFGGGETAPYCPTVSKVVDMYNLTTNSHTTTNLSVARCYSASTSSLNFIFIGGGGIGHPLTNEKGYKEVDVYNISNKSWFTLKLSEGRGYLSSTSSNNLIFFGGGWNGTHLSNTVDIFIISSFLPLNSSSSSSPQYSPIVSNSSTNSTISCKFTNDSLNLFYLTFDN